MNTIEKLQEMLKDRKNSGKFLPEIRYFEGTNAFSTPSGQYKADNLEDALVLFLQDNNG